MVRLGDRLVTDGILTRDQVEEALVSAPPGQRCGSRLISVGLVDRDAVARALAAQHRVHAALERHFDDVEPQVLGLLSADWARQLGVFPIGLVGDNPTRLAVALCDPGNEQALQAVAEVTGMALMPAVAAEIVIRGAIALHYDDEAATPTPEVRPVVPSPYNTVKTPPPVMPATEAQTPDSTITAGPLATPTAATMIGPGIQGASGAKAPHASPTLVASHASPTLVASHASPTLMVAPHASPTLIGDAAALWGTSVPPEGPVSGPPPPRDPSPSGPPALGIAVDGPPAVEFAPPEESTVPAQLFEPPLESHRFSLAESAGNQGPPLMADSDEVPLARPEPGQSVPAPIPFGQAQGFGSLPPGPQNALSPEPPARAAPRESEEPTGFGPPENTDSKAFSHGLLALAMIGVVAGVIAIPRFLKGGAVDSVGSYAAEHVGVTLTFPSGWKHVKGDDMTEHQNNVTTNGSWFYRGGTRRAPTLALVLASMKVTGMPVSGITKPQFKTVLRLLESQLRGQKSQNGFVIGEVDCWLSDEHEEMTGECSGDASADGIDRMFIMYLWLEGDRFILAGFFHEDDYEDVAEEINGILGSIALGSQN